jgi:hypothetical protein
MKWHNLYGAPSSSKGPHARQMNQSAEHASVWKGRIQLCFECEDCEQPIMDTQPIEESAREYLEVVKTKYKYEIIA